MHTQQTSLQLRHSVSSYQQNPPGLYILKQDAQDLNEQVLTINCKPHPKTSTKHLLLSIKGIYLFVQGTNRNTFLLLSTVGLLMSEKGDCKLVSPLCDCQHAVHCAAECGLKLPTLRLLSKTSNP